MNLKEIKKNSLGPKELDSHHARIIGNSISTRITWLFYKLRISANSATLLMYLIGISGCLFLAIDEITAIIGAFLIWLATFLDQVDGQLARLTRTANIKAFFYDQMYHLITFSLFFITISINSFQIHKNILIFIFPTIAIFSIFFKRELMIIPSFTFFAKVSQSKFKTQQNLIQKNLISPPNKISLRCKLRTAITEFEIYSLLFILVAIIDPFIHLDLKTIYLIIGSIILLIDYLDHLRTFIKEDHLNQRVSELIQRAKKFN